MPLAFPFPLADFQDVLRVSTRGFSVKSPMNLSRTAGGAALRSSIGEPVWRGSFQTALTNSRSDAGRLQALLSVLDRAGSSFLVYDPAKPYPASDADGSVVGATSPTVRLLDAGDARLVALQGLPVGYVLTGGDYIGWTYTVGGATRYALHQVVEDVTANGSGETALFEVTPFIQPGVVTGDAVSLVKPVMKATLEPDPDYGTARAVVSSGTSFSFTQSLR